jgi:hypothetical protein
MFGPVVAWLYTPRLDGTVPSRPSRHPRIRPRIIAIPHRRDVIRLFIGRLAPSRTTATSQIPIAA